MPEGCPNEIDCCVESNFAYQVVPDTDQFELQIVIDPEEGGSAEGAGFYDQYDFVTVTATPETDFEFIGWFDENGLLLSDEEEYTFQLTNNMIVTARFGAS